ncbi:hypothetical protein BDZ45DRAFT_371259 [Acephala macrosclerotiorum]|nr:hypothetical protein BDZ45DRAFT_371259 [Acephala macrosclerotiorum]
MADSTQSAYRTSYRDDRQDDFDSDIEEESDKLTKGVRPYRVTPSRVEEVEHRYPGDERGDFERYERFGRPRSAIDMRASSMNDEYVERRYPERERENRRTALYERERERSRSLERGLPPTGQWRDPREMYERETEYYSRPEMLPQPIVIRERAPEPQQIIVQEAPKPPPMVIPRRDSDDEEYYYRRDVREHSSLNSGERRRSPSRTRVRGKIRGKIIRRESSRSYSPSHKSHLAEGALAGAGATALLASHRAERGKGKQNEMKDIGAGTDTVYSGLAGAAVAGAYESRRGRKDAREDRRRSRSRARSIGTYSDPGVDPELGMIQYGCAPVFNHATAYQQGGGIALGAIGAEVLTRARSRYGENRDDRSRSRSRWRSRSRSRQRHGSISRSRSRSLPPKLKIALSLAGAGIAASPAKYVANCETNKKEVDRGRSRTRSPPIRWVQYRDDYDSDDDHDDRWARARSRITKAGAATASVAGVTEHFRNRSRRRSEERSRSRVRGGTEIAGVGLAGAAVAGLYESRKPKEFPPYGISDLVTSNSSTTSVLGRGGRGGRPFSLRFGSISRVRTDNQTRLNALNRFADDPNISSSVPSNTVSDVTDDPAKQSEIPEMATRNTEVSIGSPSQALVAEEKATSKINLEIDRAVPSQPSENGTNIVSPKDAESRAPTQQGSSESGVLDGVLLKLEDISACLPLAHPTRQAVTKSWPPDSEPLQAHRIRYHTQWDLPNFVASCFADLPPSKRRVENIFTITGDNENAQGTSAENYLKENWPEIFDVLLRGLNDFVKQPSEDRNNITVSTDGITLDLRKDSNEANQVLVSVEAPYTLHVSFAAAFSWICAAFRRTDHDVVYRSAASVWAANHSPEIKEVTAGSDTGKRIEVRLNSLDPIEPANSCWYDLFPGYVLASGHAIRPRKQGIGLEIAFVDMVLTSQCLSFVTEPSSLVIHGLTSVLIPMFVLPKDNALQWHFEDKLKQKDMKIAQLSDVLALPKFKDRAVLHDLKLESLFTRRCFLGYAAKANITIGTKDYPIKFDRSQARTSTNTPRITSPNYLPIGSGPFTSTSIFQQGMLAASSYKSLLRICAASRDQLVLVFDASQEIGWYLPQTSVILHLAQSHLRFCDYVLYKAVPQSAYDYRSTRREINSYESESGCAGFSSPHSDGHAEALAAIRKSLKLKVKIRNDVDSPEDEDFGQILQQFWHLLSYLGAALGSQQTTSPATIKGVDLRDIVTLQNGINVKEVEVDQPWALLTQVQPLVLMVRNIQPPIVPELENICKTWRSIPTGRKYLVTTGSIIRSFLERQVNGLGENLEWEAGRDLIQTHGHGISPPVYHAQRLRVGGKSPPNNYLLSLLDKHPDSCLVFGNSKEQKCSEKALCEDPKCCPISRSKAVQVMSRSPVMACRDTKRTFPEVFSTAMSLNEDSSTVSSEATSNSLHLTDGTSEPETPSPSTPRLLSDMSSTKSNEASFTLNTNTLSDIIPGLSSEPIWLQKSEKGHVAKNRISRLPKRSGIPVSTLKAESRTQQSSNWEVQKP